MNYKYKGVKHCYVSNAVKKNTELQTRNLLPLWWVWWEVGEGPRSMKVGRSQCPHSQQGIEPNSSFKNSHPETADPWLAFDGSYPLNHLILPMFSRHALFLVPVFCAKFLAADTEKETSS